MRQVHGALFACLAVALPLVGCGGSTGGSGASSGSSGGTDPTTLLADTFSAKHRIESGNLAFSLTITPSGSSSVRGPITLSMGGPFQSLGTGKVPASDLTLRASGLGKSGSIGLVSTGSAAYLTLSGASYQIPASAFQRLGASFGGGKGGSGLGGGFGIDPRKWLTGATVAGHESIDGTDTDHVTASVDVPKLLDSLASALQRAGSLSAGAANVPTLTPQLRSKIAASIRHPRVDVWTGASDRILRKLSITLEVPVSGSASTMLGGLTSAGIALTLGYSQVGRHQTIAAPGNVRPISELQTKLVGLASGLRGVLGSSALSNATSGSSTNPSAGGGAATGSTGASGAAALSGYARCIQAAGSDVTKMQGCASLLSGH